MVCGRQKDSEPLGHRISVGGEEQAGDVVRIGDVVTDDARDELCALGYGFKCKVRGYFRPVGSIERWDVEPLQRWCEAVAVLEAYDSRECCFRQP